MPMDICYDNDTSSNKNSAQEDYPMATAMKEIRERVSAEEWQIRQDLAALYRLVAMYGWDDLVFTHITARVPGPEHHFLINPYGMLFETVTASCLIKVDLDGNKIIDSPYPLNPAGYMIHSAVHEVREDAECIMHLHTKAGVAVSAQKNGLLPISQQASVALGSLAYHDYEGIALNPDEKGRLQQDLGDKLAMILRNHGTLVAAPTIADAWLFMYNLETACQIQIAAQAGGGELVMFGEDIIRLNCENLAKATAGQGGRIAWAAMLDKIDRHDPSFRD
jgi:ribulose-5-phosphate 4-epimerase/fuculose-1-phosphate aldolase